MNPSSKSFTTTHQENDGQHHNYNNNNIQDLDQIILELSRKEAIQNEKRERCSQIFDSIQKYQAKINVMREQIRDTQHELQILDDEIDDLQMARERILQRNGGAASTGGSSGGHYSNHGVKDEMENRFDYQVSNRCHVNEYENGNEDEEYLVNACQYKENGRGDNDDFKFQKNNISPMADDADRISAPWTKASNHNTSSVICPSNHTANEKIPGKVSSASRGGTLDGYFQVRPSSRNQNMESNNLPSRASVHDSHVQSAVAHHAPSSSTSLVSNSIFPPKLQSHFQENHRGGNHSHAKAPQCDPYPWTTNMYHELQNTFHIENFRDHQKEIINCTMSGHDVFVIMRTGGGKSLTYQLPALLEGKGPARKVTLVVSPLLSLIRDQEDQMNQFSRGTATSFSSGLSSAEQTRRWNLVRDPNGGICLIFVTPEKVYKSGKLKSEMEKLNQQNRLGRFVIDECHCCSQWGYDFRTDYTKLGILKQHFPHIPLIAVTATASDRVREDCCNILKIGRNYRFFRSSANRPNLKYCVKIKPEKADDVVEAMASFIREHHPRNAGIIYCFSKKEANSVAEKLSNMGISAKPYHSDVSDTAKERIHRSWMSNKTQVVVATIAFGLGINKPDVRFVLHHSLSKTLEAYYQESGRAGRDGGEADCVLYYSPKDVCRTLGMIHGERTEIAFWSMARYAQMHGDDALCKRIILSNLGEPGSEKIEDVINSGGANSTTEEREIGKLCKDMVRMIYESGRDMTMAQIVQMWRSKGKDTPDYIKDTSPNSELTKDECERILVSLMISNILYPNVKFTAYNNIVYIGLKPQAMHLIQSQNPKVRIRFPIRDRDSTPKTTGQNKKKTVATNDDSGWISTKKSSSVKKPKKRPQKGTKNKGEKKRKTNVIAEQKIEVIDILDDSSDEDEDNKVSTKPVQRNSVNQQTSSKKKRKLLDHLESSESEYEFE